MQHIAAQTAYRPRVNGSGGSYEGQVKLELSNTI